MSARKGVTPTTEELHAQWAAANRAANKAAEELELAMKFHRLAVLLAEHKYKQYLNAFTEGES